MICLANAEILDVLHYEDNELYWKPFHTLFILFGGQNNNIKSWFVTITITTNQVILIEAIT